jgi:hypothetical protein
VPAMQWPLAKRTLGIGAATVRDPANHLVALVLLTARSSGADTRIIVMSLQHDPADSLWEQSDRR